LVSSPCRRSSSAARCFGLKSFGNATPWARMAASFRAARQFSWFSSVGGRRRVRVSHVVSRWTGDFIRRGPGGLKSPVAHAFRTLHVTAAAESRRKLRFALVGCGRIATNHFAALRQHAERAEWVGVCDNRPAALAARSRRPAARIRVARRAAGRLQCRCRRARHSERFAPAPSSESGASGRHVVAKSRWRRSGTKVSRWCVPAATPA